MLARIDEAMVLKSSTLDTEAPVKPDESMLRRAASLQIRYSSSKAKPPFIWLGACRAVELTNVDSKSAVGMVVSL